MPSASLSLTGTRTGSPGDEERSRYHQMMDMRDDDVHRQETTSDAMASYTSDRTARHMFGGVADVETENPDEEKVVSPVLGSMVPLFVQREGRLIKAVEAGKDLPT
jgi:hypothetical protein